MTLSTTTTALIQSQVSSLLVQPLEQASVVLAAGPQIFNSSEPLRIPKVTAGINAGFVAENAEITAADVAFSEVSLMPSDRTSIKALTKFSNEMLRQSVVGLDATLKTRLVTDVSNALDTALLTGAGTAKSITGILNQTGVQTGVLDVADPDSLLDALALASAEEVVPNRWFLSGADFIALRKLKEATGSKKYLLESNVHADATYSLFGIPVTVTNKLATGKAILADMSQVAVVRDIDPSVTILPERYAEFDQVGIRVVTRYDVGLLHPKGVVVLTDAP